MTWTNEKNQKPYHMIYTDNTDRIADIARHRKAQDKISKAAVAAGAENFLNDN